MPNVQVGIQTTYNNSGAAAAAQGLNTVAQNASKADKALLQSAQTQARLASSQGDAARSAQILSNALSQVDRTTLQALRAETQLVNANNALAKSSQAASGGFAVLPRTIAGFSGEAQAAAQAIQGVVSSVTAAAGAFVALKGVYDIAQLGAQAQLVETRFNGLAVAAGTTGDALIKALRAGSGGEISDLNLQLAANKAQLLGVAHSAEEFGTLMAIARDRAQQMGISTTQAFDDLVTGLGRGSKLILDNLGILVNTDQANQAYAASIGKTVSALTDQERKQALINQVLKDGQATIAQTGGAVESTASQIAQGQAAFENLKAAVGELAAIRLGPLASDVGAVVNALAGSGDKLAALGSGFDLASKINPQISVLQTLQGAVDAVITSFNGMAGLQLPDIAAPLRAGADAYRDLAVQLGLLPNTEAEVAAAAAAAADTMESARAREVAATNMAMDTVAAYRAIEVQGAADAAAAAQAQLAYADSLEMAGIQARAAAAAAEIKANADQVAAVDAQTHKVAQEQLALQAQAAAQTLLNAGVAGANTAAQLAGSSQQVDVLTAAYYRLYAAQRAAGAGATQQQAADFRSMEVFGQTAAQRTAQIEKERAAEAALAQQIIATGTTKQKIAVLQKQYNDAVRQSGAGSAEAINAQTRLIQAQEKGGAGRVAAAGAAASKLEGIETKTGDKIAEIVADTQQKITAIAEREAAKQQAALQKLNESIATSGADRRVSNEVDDLDLIGVTDPKEAAKLNDREKAQAKAREAEKRAADEARATALAGDAELAQKQYEIREKQIGDQQALDEKYAEKQRELAEDPALLDAAKTQYDEATRANEERAKLGIDLAGTEAEQKKKALDDEKAAIVQAANDQANDVISAAQRSAQGVKNASGDARKVAVEDLGKIGDAVNAIPSQKTITITVNQQGTVGAASTGGSSPNKSAGGGTFLSHGPTTLTVGDNPGGVELVSVTPISGTGQTRVGGGLTKMAGGGVVVVDAGDGYTTPVAGGPTPTPGKGKGKGKNTPAPADPKAVREAIKESIELIKLQNELRKVQAEAQRLRPMPINYKWIEGLAIEAQEITRVVTSKLLPLKKDEAEALGKYASANGQAVDVLKNIADLRDMQAIAKKERPGEIVIPYIEGLASEAQRITQIVRDRLTPSTELESEMYSAWADAVSSSVSVLKDIADLRKEQAATVKNASTNRDAWYVALADEAVRVARIVKDRAVPASEEERDGLSSFADVVGSSVGVLKDVSELTSKLFTDYQSPTDAQIALITDDARRISKAFFDAGVLLGKDGAEAGKTYAEGVGAVFAAAKDGLLVIDALKSGDFILPDGALKQFEGSSMSIIDTMERLSGRASQIPAENIAALQTVTAAISGQAEALIKLAAVPFGNLAVTSGGYAGAAMGSGPAPTINIYPQPGQDPNAIANLVVQKINTQYGSRR